MSDDTRNMFRTILMGALGLCVAGVLGYLSLELVSQPVGISEEPQTAGNLLVRQADRQPTDRAGSTDSKSTSSNSRSNSDDAAAPAPVPANSPPAAVPVTPQGTSPDDDGGSDHGGGSDDGHDGGHGDD